jgi:hypothetical protein
VVLRHARVTYSEVVDLAGAADMEQGAGAVLLGLTLAGALLYQQREHRQRIGHLEGMGNQRPAAWRSRKVFEMFWRGVGGGPAIPGFASRLTLRPGRPLWLPFTLQLSTVTAAWPRQFTSSYLNCHQFTWEHPSLTRNKGNTILLALPIRIVKGSFQTENHST